MHQVAEVESCDLLDYRHPDWEMSVSEDEIQWDWQTWRIVVDAVEQVEVAAVASQEKASHR